MNQNFILECSVKIHIKCHDLTTAKEHIKNGFYDSWEFIKFKDK